MIAVKSSSLIQIVALVAIVVSLALYTFDGFGVKIFLVTILGIIALAAPETIDDIGKIVRGKR